MESDRQEQLLLLLREKKYVSINFLVETLHYSESTIRRDLRRMEKLGLIKRSPGGAMFIKDDLKENPLQLKAGINRDQKRRIADIAVDLIGDYSTIFLDASSTCLILSKQLQHRHNLTILTTNLLTALELETNTDHNVYIVGGHLRDGKVEGGVAEENISAFQIDTAFVSCRGFDQNFGASEILESEATMKRIVKHHTKQLVLLADGTKLGKRFLFQGLAPRDIDTLVTNQPVSKEMGKFLSASGIECLDGD